MSDQEALIPFEPGPPRRGSGFGTRPSGGSDLEIERTDTFYYLRAYWHVLVKRKWTVLTVVTVLTTLVAVVSFKMQPVYEARSRVEVENETPEVQSLSDLYRSTPTDEEFLETQVNVLKSDNLAWQTLSELGLGHQPAFDPKASGPSAAGSSASSGERAELIRRFAKNLHVELMRNSRMLEVDFDSPDPQLGARVVNSLVANYIEYNFRKKYDATRQASGWMEQQLDELKAKVEKSQKALVDYERRNAIVNVSDKENVIEQRLADLSKDLTAAENDRVQKESLDRLIQADESQAATLADDQLLERLQEKTADLQSEYVSALGQYGPKFPRVVHLREQLDAIQSDIRLERQRTLERVHNNYRAAVDREKLLTDSVTREKAEVGQLNELLIQHNLLKREFETNQQLYDSLLQRLKDATVSAGLRATNIHVLDSAIPPAVPVRPKKLLNVSIALIAGLILGVTLAFVEEGLDNSIKSAEDVERLIGVPSLAIVPASSSMKLLPYPASRAHRNGGNHGKNGQARVELAVLNQPASALAESYRALRTAILLSRSPRPPQTILVTSPNPDEGKSCTSLNLALALAQRGGRVLLIDGDLRKRSLARYLGLTNHRGLSGFLTGAYPLADALARLESAPRLAVLPAGPPAPNPAELLSSLSMEAALAELRRSFDHIVIDSPPALMVTDATILSPLADGLILVVESEATVRGALLRTHQILESAGGKILGVVMNKVNLERDGYYYYGRHHRQYQYSCYGDASSETKGDSVFPGVPEVDDCMTSVPRNGSSS
jgi:polysaccharide biosynthesis transport protein